MQLQYCTVYVTCLLQYGICTVVDVLSSFQMITVEVLMKDEVEKTRMSGDEEKDNAGMSTG